MSKSWLMSCVLLMLFISFMLPAKGASEVRLIHKKISQGSINQTIRVKANVINAQNVNYIILYYRNANDKNWSSVEMNPEEGMYLAEIPGGEVKDAGLFYYIEVVDIQNRSSFAFASSKDPQYVMTKKGEKAKPEDDLAGEDDVFGDELAYYVETLEEEEVVTASKYAQSISVAPANITVITGKEIEQKGYRNFLDILRDQGFDINDNGSWADVGLRGINDRTTYGKYLLIFLDGHNMSFTQFYRNIISQGMIPLEDIKRIEIQKGPGSSIWGANALLGVVNVITRDYASSSQLTLRGGSHSFKDVHLRASKVFHPKFSVFASFYAHEHDLSDDMVVKEWSNMTRSVLGKHKDVTLNNMSQTNYTFFSKVNLFDLKMTFYYNRYDPYAPITTFSVGGDDTRLVTDRYYATLQYENDLVSNKSIDFSVNGSISYDHYAFSEGAQYEDNPYNPGGASSAQFIRKMEAEDHKVDLKFYSVLGIKPAKTTLLLGIDFEYLDATRWKFPELVDTDDSLKDSDFEFTQSNFGVFLQAEFGLIPHLNLIAGGRYDKNSKYDAQISPKAGLVFSYGKTFAKALWGMGYKAPSLHELYYFRKNAFYGNSQLKPETSQSIEIQAGYRNKGKVELSATFYQVQIEDVISYKSKKMVSDFVNKDNEFPESQLPDPTILEDPSKFSYSQQENQKEYKSIGGELQFKVFPVKSLSLSVTAGYYQATNEGDDERLDYSAELFISGAINYSFNGWLNTNLSMRYVGDKKVAAYKFTEPGNPYNEPEDSTTDVDPYFLLNLNIGVIDKPVKGVSMGFRIENILGTEYYDAGREILYPQVGRMFWGYMKFKF